MLVAFAAIGGIPTKINAGNERKLPPPATELMSPAKKAAVKRKADWPKCTRKNKPYWIEKSSRSLLLFNEHAATEPSERASDQLALQRRARGKNVLPTPRVLH